MRREAASAAGGMQMATTVGRLGIEILSVRETRTDNVSLVVPQFSSTWPSQSLS